MKYKLINNKTKEEHLCDKVTIDGFDYYVSDKEQPKIDGELYHCKHKGKGIDVGSGQPPQRLIIDIYSTKRNLCSDCKKVIATNNPNIDIPKVVDVFLIVEQWVKSKEKLVYQYWDKPSFIEGYNKAKETYTFSEEDMIEFSIWRNITVFDKPLTPKGELELWKEQKPKIVYYNG